MSSNSSKLTDYLQQNSIARSFIIGSFSSTCSTLLFQPLDLLKTRMQNIQYITANPHSGLTMNRMRMLSTCNDVIRTESVIGLWRGTVPSLLRCIPGVGLYFASLHQLQTLICGQSKDKPSAGQAMIIGASARSLAASILIPVTVIKTHYESGHFSYKSIPNAFKLIYRQHGFRGLYSGAFPTMLRDVPYSGIYYMFYSQLKGYASNCLSSSSHRYHHPDNKQPSLETFINFTCSLISGVLASIVTHPADVIKTKMQLDPKKFNGLTSSVGIIFRDKGSIGFFIGLTPRLMRRALMTAFTWTIFEHCIRSLGFK